MVRPHVLATGPTRQAGPVGVGAGGLPVRSNTISACLIVRDEETALPGCLESLRGAVDEVVVVDTGSQDRTVAVAAAAGARVLHHAWNDDFAAARNVGLFAAQGEWLLFIDADERLGRSDGQPARAADLLHALRSGQQDTYEIQVVNFADSAGQSIADLAWVRRFARNRPGLRFSGRIHENLRGVSTIGRLTPFRLYHFGYTPEAWTRKNKRERNIAMLQRQRDEEPMAAHTRFFLGREYVQTQRFAEALKELQRAFALLQGNRPPYWFDLVLYWVEALRLSGRWTVSIQQCDLVLREFPAFAELWLVRGRCHLALGRVQDAVQDLLRCIAVHGRDDRVLVHIAKTPAAAWQELGRCYEHLGQPQHALAAYREALRCHPTLEGTVEAAARVALAAGERPEDIEAWVLAAVPGEVVPAVALGLWSLYAAADRWEQAVRWADAQVQAPGDARAVERRAITLMRAGHWQEALEAFGAAAELAEGGRLDDDATWAQTLLAMALGRDDLAADTLARIAPRPDPRLRAASRLLDRAASTEGGGWWTEDRTLRRGLLQLADQLLSVGADAAASRVLVRSLIPLPRSLDPPSPSPTPAAQDAVWAAATR
jgi:glycosyltransferase involved in cell wall biosynthesis